MKEKLELYSRSENNIWTDGYIANNMLTAHLDYQNDGASRNIRTIEKTVNWIISISEEKRNLMDLGCGPGIYANMFNNLGYSVTGLDISSTSINHAKTWANKENKNITYLCKNYIKEEIEGKYDIAICIYCDFGALIPNEQITFLKNVSNALNRDGLLIFDVFGHGLCNRREEKRSWSFNKEVTFWSKKPHIILEESVHYVNEMTWGSRTIIVEEDSSPREYILWDSYYDEDKINRLLGKNGFQLELIRKDLIEENKFTSSDVMFIKARKI